MENIWQTWKSLPEDIQSALKKAVEQASSEKQSGAEIMICPKCKSTDTRDCDEVDCILDRTIGLCMDCGHLFCSECKRDLTQNLNCKHWEICNACLEVDEEGLCAIGADKCKKLESELTETE